MTAEAVGLLLGFLFAHYLGDFTPLATRGMQRAKANGRPLGPIAGHAAVHGALVGLAVFGLTAATAALVVAAAAVEFGTHFAIDTARGRIGSRVPALGDPHQNAYWYALGADQLAHGVVLVGLAAWVLS